MVQICSGCSEKHTSLAEGGPPAPAAPVSESGPTHSLESTSAMYSTSGTNASNHGTAFVGRTSPSEKSITNSDSTSNVRFKVRLQLHDIDIDSPFELALQCASAAWTGYGKHYRYVSIVCQIDLVPHLIGEENKQTNNKIELIVNNNL